MSVDEELEVPDLPALSTAEDCAAFCGAYSACAAFDTDTSWSPCKFYTGWVPLKRLGVMCPVPPTCRYPTLNFRWQETLRWTL